jgi:adenylate cyclase
MNVVPSFVTPEGWMRTPLHTFLFADLVGFTALAELHGDDVAADVAVRFATEASRLADEHGATTVKSLGDAVMIRADDAAEAMLLGTRLHEELGVHAGLPPAHAGAHTGRAVERGGDWFGAAVNLASRVTDAARGGELLVTEATLAAAGDVRGVDVDPLGPQAFKNVAGQTAVYSVRASARTAERRVVGDVLKLRPRPAVAAAMAT